MSLKRVVIKGRFQIILNRDKKLDNKEFMRLRRSLLEEGNKIVIVGSQGFWIPVMSQKIMKFKRDAREGKE